MLFAGLATFIVAVFVTWLVTPGVIRLAHGLGAVDLPGGRKMHGAPIPRIGGVAVFAGFTAGLACASYAAGNLLAFSRVSVHWRGMALVASGMLLVGLLDDLWGLSFRAKFLAQTLAAVAVYLCGFRIEAIAGFPALGLLALPLTVLWIVGVTNAVNLIDGLDGLATGIALITTCAVSVIALVRGEFGVAAASVALAGSLVGFLPFNFNPARIFLGDSGSLFLGFILAVTSVRGSQKGPTVVAVLVPLLVLGLPLLDTTLAVVRRMYRLSRRAYGTSPRPLRFVVGHLQEVFLPDRGHIHHRLLDVGLSHRRAVLVLYGVGGLFVAAAFGLVLLRSVVLAALLAGVLGLLMTAFLVALYWRIRRAERAAAAQDGA
ncbi:MAG TPA: MraY family glycosyltransferase, partial [Candidatus Polarisedimenticolaceae bacterium]|nr:MraY family glycosyltransferase [Candidatus Polarisedimenticolaceae bacterium]